MFEFDHLDWIDFPICNNQILDEHEEGDFELATGDVHCGCGVYFFECQYELLDWRSFHPSCLVKYL